MHHDFCSFYIWSLLFLTCRTHNSNTIVLPSWSNQITKINSKDTKGAPGLLIITSAATRATDVVRYKSSYTE